jgi:hypothetical protein
VKTNSAQEATLRLPIAQALLLVMVLAVFVFPTVSSALANDQSQRVNVTFLDCPENSQNPSNVRAGLIRPDGTHSEATFSEATPSAVRHFSLNVIPGNYDLVVANGDCADTLQLTILHGFDRDVVALARHTTVLVGRTGSISGTLPEEGWQAAMVFKNRPGDSRNLSPDGFEQVPVVVNGAAYYATHLPLGHATLRLYNQGFYRWIDVPIGNIGPNQAAVVHNVTVQEIENAHIAGL